MAEKQRNDLYKKDNKIGIEIPSLSMVNFLQPIVSLHFRSSQRIKPRNKTRNKTRNTYKTSKPYICHSEYKQSSLAFLRSNIETTEEIR